MRIALVLVSGLALRAQSVERQPAFEVVSIKPLDQPQRGAQPKIDPARVSYPNATLRLLIMRAYDLANYQLDGPSWLQERHLFAFSAKIPDGASERQIPEMLQNMLADRFGLKVHWESRVQPVYALAAAKGGPKVKRSDVSKAETGADGGPTGSLDIHPSTGQFAFRTTTMGELARFLSGQLGRPVLDVTELSGSFDFEFDANPADLDGFRRTSAAGDAPVDDAQFPSIFTGLQSLGLKLESRKAPINHLIIDSALKVPTSN
jgi:uncharacterized protein (TIGR03435 family)